MPAMTVHTFHDHAHRVPDAPSHTVTRTLAEILPVLALAHEKGMAWLSDFTDEPIQISPDLDEVINAFRDFCMD